MKLKAKKLLHLSVNEIIVNHNFI